jgi:hypothetical protein
MAAEVPTSSNECQARSIWARWFAAQSRAIDAARPVVSFAGAALRVAGVAYGGWGAERYLLVAEGRFSGRSTRYSFAIVAAMIATTAAHQT